MVKVPTKVRKQAEKMPASTKAVFYQLLLDLRESPLQPAYRNYSPLGNDKYHCHLDYHWVACWHWEKGSVFVEVYYAGSRENAPY